MSGNTHVPDKLEGYLLQVRHALFELISLDDRIVSVEAFDDVAVETDDTIIAEQTKSVLSNNNPVANRSVVFWKTLKNWCEYLKGGDLPNKTIILRYVIVAAHRLNIGSIPKSFSDAKNEVDARSALDVARLELLGDGTTEAPDLGTQVKEYVEYCFSAENEATMLQVISLMEIDLHETTYDDELRTQFNRQIIPPEYSDSIFLSMLGWVADQVHEQTKLNLPAYISSEDYRKELLAQVRSRDQRQILAAISLQPSSSETTAELDRRDTYIKQLEFIDADTGTLYEAASDFLRTITEKTLWAQKGIVTTHSIEEYNEGLKKMWKGRKVVVNTMPTTEKLRGNALLSVCMADAVTHRIQGADPPTFFGSGSLHVLANEPSTHPVIGWHPRYTELLMEAEENGDESC